LKDVGPAFLPAIDPPITCSPAPELTCSRRSRVGPAFQPVLLEDRLSSLSGAAPDVEPSINPTEAGIRTGRLPLDGFRDGRSAVFHPDVA